MLVFLVPSFPTTIHYYNNNKVPCWRATRRRIYKRITNSKHCTRKSLKWLVDLQPPRVSLAPTPTPAPTPAAPPHSGPDVVIL